MLKLTGQRPRFVGKPVAEYGVRYELPVLQERDGEKRELVLTLDLFEYDDGHVVVEGEVNYP